MNHLHDVDIAQLAIRKVLDSVKLGREVPALIEGAMAEAALRAVDFDKLKKDAIRYRHLRDRMEVTRNSGCPSVVSMDYLRTEVRARKDTDFIDRAIDNDMREP